VTSATQQRYSTLIPDQQPDDLTIVRTETSDVVGTAQFLMETWAPHQGIHSLYELFTGDITLGVHVLQTDGTFLPYETWVEQARLPPEPQHAMNAAMLYPEARERDLVCLVFRPEFGDSPAGFYFFQKRPFWTVGRWEGLPSQTLLDALHLFQKVRTQRLLLPFRLPEQNG
jgi:hypothetical protein